jgi:hypothetical protein
MLANILTCVLTGSIGVGTGLIINTVRAKNTKRKADDISNTSQETSLQPTKLTKVQKDQEPKKSKNLIGAYGLQSYFATIEKYTASKEEIHANVSIRKHVRRILELIEQNESQAAHSKYWNVGGAVSVNATKVKLWSRTLHHLLKDRLSKLPDDLDEALKHIQAYVEAEQYNRLLR